MQISGNVNWNKEEVKEVKKDKTTKTKRKTKVVSLPDFTVLDKLLKDSQDYYKKVPKKEMGDIIVTLELLKNKIEKII